MMCDDCTIERQTPGHRRFNPACLYCGARYFQSLRSFPQITVGDDGSDRAETKAERQDWRARVLRTWADAGHNIEVLKELSAGKEVPVAPPAGLASVQAAAKPARPTRGRAKTPPQPALETTA